MAMSAASPVAPTIVNRDGGMGANTLVGRQACLEDAA
jgi:hypothetical protein